MADIFDVIADGTRRDILRLLLERESESDSGTSVSQIVSELGVSQPTVSKHLKVLRDAHLVSVREEGQHRYYSLSPEPLDEVDDWLVPFLTTEDDLEIELPVALSDSAAHAAEAVGRAAASARYAVANAWRKLPGR
ncbi:winged helix-turn-helix transcriptional regulator [Microbacterium schleiferi]|uniref:Winged helix-turn-helix transcriptional regulator n=1 Tax=Microbacterium schleiferi TaxID=69362 RepID=A0A7S8RGK9_9MICO|nr:metalloregulator ArsR/SmtB family transcription factor [Microbacterium schleiferi]QPE04216.1 winged helix-turn-helix transcriptional regulator [Microbacterium schleiferi]